MIGYFISAEDINLDRGCCSCPLKTGGGRFCSRGVDDITEHILHYTRPEECPLHRVDSILGLVNLDNVPMHKIQEYHEDLQRPGFPKEVFYSEDAFAVRIEGTYEL